MVTLVVLVGTNGQLQLAVLFHAVLEVPVQVPGLFTVTLITLPVLVHPEVEFLTVNVPVYVPAPGFDGTVNDMGEAGKLVLLKFVNPAMIAPADQAMLY
jgi:hypothetical protein